MISDNNTSNPISSSNVRNNFKNNKKNRYMGLKISVFLGVVMFLFLIYFIYNKFSGQSVDNPKNASKITEQKTSQLIQQTPLDSVITIDESDQVNPIIELSAYGNSPNILRENLKNISSSYMRNKEYTPISCKISSDFKRITFKLVKKPSDYTKLSLCFGVFDATTNSCESCNNVLAKNNGSYEITSRNKTSNNFIFKVISIKE